VRASGAVRRPGTLRGQQLHALIFLSSLVELVGVGLDLIGLLVGEILAGLHAETEGVRGRHDFGAAGFEIGERRRIHADRSEGNGAEAGEHRQSRMRRECEALRFAQKGVLHDHRKDSFYGLSRLTTGP
jgi:hypothetical protein